MSTFEPMDPDLAAELCETLDLIDEMAARVTPEFIERKLQETMAYVRLMQKGPARRGFCLHPPRRSRS